jgi:hypothetical protein
MFIIKEIAEKVNRNSKVHLKFCIRISSISIVKQLMFLDYIKRYIKDNYKGISIIRT